VPSYTHLAYRRNAKAAARNQQIKQPKNAEDLKRAREDFGFFCDYVADKPPAEHHKNWHRHFVTNENSNCLIKIAGPNVDLLAPRGSAKSTVLGLLTAWAIGIHTQAKMPLQDNRMIYQNIQDELDNEAQIFSNTYTLERR